MAVSQPKTKVVGTTIEKPNMKREKSSSEVFSSSQITTIGIITLLLLLVAYYVTFIFPSSTPVDIIDTHTSGPVDPPVIKRYYTPKTVPVVESDTSKLLGDYLMSSYEPVVITGSPLSSSPAIREHNLSPGTELPSWIEKSSIDIKRMGIQMSNTRIFGPTPNINKPLKSPSTYNINPSILSKHNNNTILYRRLSSPQRLYIPLLEIYHILSSLSTKHATTPYYRISGTITRSRTLIRSLLPDNNNTTNNNNDNLSIVSDNNINNTSKLTPQQQLSHLILGKATDIQQKEYPKPQTIEEASIPLSKIPYIPSLYYDPSSIDINLYIDQQYTQITPQYIQKSTLYLQTYGEQNIIIITPDIYNDNIDILEAYPYQHELYGYMQRHPFTPSFDVPSPDQPESSQYSPDQHDNTNTRNKKNTLYAYEVKLTKGQVLIIPASSYIIKYAPTSSISISISYKPIYDKVITNSLLATSNSLLPQWNISQRKTALVFLLHSILSTPNLLRNIPNITYKLFYDIYNTNTNSNNNNISYKDILSLYINDYDTFKNLHIDQHKAFIFTLDPFNIISEYLYNGITEEHHNYTYLQKLIPTKHDNNNNINTLLSSSESLLCALSQLSLSNLSISSDSMPSSSKQQHCSHDTNTLQSLSNLLQNDEEYSSFSLSHHPLLIEEDIPTGETLSSLSGETLSSLSQTDGNTNTNTDKDTTQDTTPNTTTSSSIYIPQYKALAGQTVSYFISHYVKPIYNHLYNNNILKHKDNIILDDNNNNISKQCHLSSSLEIPDFTTTLFMTETTSQSLLGRLPWLQQHPDEYIPEYIYHQALLQTGLLISEQIQIIPTHLRENILISLVDNISGLVTAVDNTSTVNNNSNGLYNLIGANNNQALTLGEWLDCLEYIKLKL